MGCSNTADLDTAALSTVCHAADLSSRKSLPSATCPLFFNGFCFLLLKPLYSPQNTLHRDIIIFTSIKLLDFLVRNGIGVKDYTRQT